MTPPEVSRMLVQWHRLAVQIRLGLYPDEPRLISSYLQAGEQLVTDLGKDPAQASWRIYDRMLSLLLATAYDGLLPIVWRSTCLDACCRPLTVMGSLVHDEASARRLRTLSQRLASFTYNP